MEPRRSCVGCREVAPKADLLRFVADGEALVPDPEARRSGRGAYLHPRDECWREALKRRGFDRALRRKVRSTPPKPF